ncbi:hypothetical protein SLS53_002466 [Cytospora paraplurivora]|uniref:Uncharacterized protein n=1 Tax=Cytospora paraplurivora TaxID=2898453 RepID=A0AAN9YKU7_9PEZI
MKSPVLATIGGLAVLGHAQQPTLHAANVSSALAPRPQESSGAPANVTIDVAGVNVQAKPEVVKESSGSPANATIAVANVNVQTKAIIAPVPLPTTVTTTYTPDYRATCRATVIAGYTRTFCNTPEPTQRGPLRRPHGSVHEYVPEDDISENPRIVIDPERACHRGYSCQPDGGHKSHGDVYRSRDDVEKCRHNCRRDDRDCHTVIEIVFTQFDPGFYGLFREFVTFAHANAIAIAYNFHNFCIWVRVVASAPVPPPVPPPAAPPAAPPAPPPVPSPAAQPVQPYHKCPAGMHPCPHRNGTILPPTVTRAGAGYVQPVAGMAMVIAGVFGMLMV